jgi:hypothetical protein
VLQPLQSARPQVAAISLAIGVALATTLAAAGARAADSLVLISIPEAMSTPEYQNQLDGSVKFYFGDTPHPSVEHTYGNFITNKKTNGFAKEAGVACRHVLLSALIQLQNQAKSLGGNAVVNIHSYFKKNEQSHDAAAECYKGFLIAGVALKGDIVKVAGN